MDKELAALLTCAKNGDQTAFALLLSDYEPLLNAQVQMAQENAVGYGRDDLHQEAVIAFYDAVRSFDLSAAEITFGLYAKICVRNRLLSVLRKSREMENAATALAALSTQEASDSVPSPEETACDNDSFRLLLDRIMKALTPFEAAVFSLYLQNKPYRMIAASLSATEKSVGNAIYRIKAKVKKLI